MWICIYLPKHKALFQYSKAAGSVPHCYPNAMQICGNSNVLPQAFISVYSRKSLDSTKNNVLGTVLSLVSCLCEQRYWFKASACIMYAMYMTLIPMRHVKSKTNKIQAN